MSLFVTTGTTIKCPFGSAESKFIATNNPFFMIEGMPVGSIKDGSAIINIPPFGMCNNLANPAVAAATTAALGVLTPMPCTPQTKAWTPEQLNVLTGGAPCITQGCTCLCAYGGTISVVDPAQKSVTA